MRSFLTILCVFWAMSVADVEAQVRIDLSELDTAPKAQISPPNTPQNTQYQPPTQAYVDYFYPNIMNKPPYLPADNRVRPIGCDALPIATRDYKTAAEVNYQQAFWEDRVSAEWDFFSASPEQGKILLIDYAQAPNQQLAYRYLANATQNDLFEPWSASKVFTITAAMAKFRNHGIGGDVLIGNTHIADLITSIHSYAPSGRANGDSNAIATYFANLVGRGYLTALFHDEWLLLQHPQVRFKGAYGLTPWQPTSDTWLQQSDDTLVTKRPFVQSWDDPNYQTYRCTACGKTGNKPMTTLAMAEWLKRLASHTREPRTAHPHLQDEDISVLFDGVGAASSPAGMQAGISRMLHYALAEGLVGRPVNNPKQILDQLTDGQWRVWQKIGWGPSETRNTGENTLLAHICLPLKNGHREFTIAAQTSHPEALDDSVNHAGIKMQRLLTTSIKELLASKKPQTK